MIEYEDRAVAFVDVLGFKTLVKSSVNKTESLGKLTELVHLLETAIPFFNLNVNSNVAPELIPKFTYISDCIILSAPLKDERSPYYDGLEAVCMRVIQLTHHFLREGYLLRGGISVGKTWHTGTNIVGPAYQDAYKLEVDGDEPIVLLSEAACRIKPFSSRLRIKHDDKVFLNGLNDIYMSGKHEYGTIHSTYDTYKSIVENTINHGNLPADPLKKWVWFKDYLEAEASLDKKWTAA